ncbi:MAG: hypothetical protein RLO21_13745 [Nitratireductor sp.]
MTLIERAARVAAVGIEAMVRASGVEAGLVRPVTLYLLVTGCNLPGAVVARVVGCTKQNVSKHQQRIEDLRDEPGFDAQLQSFEDQLFSL